MVQNIAQKLTPSCVGCSAPTYVTHERRQTSLRRGERNVVTFNYNTLQHNFVVVESSNKRTCQMSQ